MLERLAPLQHDTLDDIPDPVENTQLIGHDEARSMIAGAYRSGKLHHALMITGPRGIGKATFAFHLAQHLFRYPDPASAPEIIEAPDMQAQAFRLAVRGAHSGLLHLSRPWMEKEKKFRTGITVDEVRRVGRFLSMSPPDGGWRVVIVDPADDMNSNAANALLKSLEEPPTRTLFILIAHSPGRLLPTVRSRCHVLRLTPLEEGQVMDVLNILGAPMPDDAATRNFLLQQAEGSARNALLLTQFGGLEIASAMQKVLHSKPFEVAAAHKLAEAVSGRDSQVQFDLFNQMILDFVAKRAAETGSSGQVQHAEQLAALWENLAERTRETEIFNLDRKQHALNMIQRTHQAMREMPLA